MKEKDCPKFPSGRPYPVVEPMQFPNVYSRREDGKHVNLRGEVLEKTREQREIEETSQAWRELGRGIIERTSKP